MSPRMAMKGLSRKCYQIVNSHLLICKPCFQALDTIFCQLYVAQRLLCQIYSKQQLLWPQSFCYEFYPENIEMISDLSTRIVLKSSN